jgi:pyruvate formate lyase activating enzyme
MKKTQGKVQEKLQAKKDDLIGKVHSVESLGTLDGPGLRTVVFLQGCPLRCKFCHNIDCTLREGGTEYAVGELVNKILSNKPYWGARGGVTFSGGEPTFQNKFLLACLEKLKEEGVNVALDTCMMNSLFVIETLLKFVDLWMITIKHMDPVEHKELTGIRNEVILRNIRYLDELITEHKLKAKIRIRVLVIPEINDSEENLKKLGEFVSQVKNLEVVELLAYSTHGRHKWLKLFGEYPLEGVRAATKDDLQRAMDILSEYEFEFKY